jgi:alkanesulfonate monooxygenase SsuD/methylene tetrahydromethanopterin reductase-like flavin-dependent oxidoreductase (luciferase family)
MHDLKLGVLLWNQATDWPSYIDAVRRIDRLGYTHLWAWDHLYAIFGDPYQPIFEGWESLSASAMATEKLQVGLLVGANTFRNPGLVAKLASTLDHISGGRAILGLGGAWMEPEHAAHGIDFGSGFGQRLDWLDESVAACRDLLDGKSVTSAPGGHYAFDDLRHAPLPVQAHLPIMIGGGGEKKTLRLVAQYADATNVFGSPEVIHRKYAIIDEHCAAVGRDPREIERSTLQSVNVTRDGADGSQTPDQVIERFGELHDAGADTVIFSTRDVHDPARIALLGSDVVPALHAL